MLSKKLSLKCPIHRAPSQVTGKDKRRKKLFITNFKFKIQGSRSPSQGKNESTSRICHAKKRKIGSAEERERHMQKGKRKNKLSQWTMTTEVTKKIQKMCKQIKLPFPHLVMQMMDLLLALMKKRRMTIH
ncbi:hypothetical protein K1719_030810 [Acacia pycnantha]|nr:hypothetical protein K1719_030810 [Acacia pycnantha]